MAKPIPLELPARDPREALYQRLRNAPLEHVEALLATYDILQGLHDRGVLEMMRGALGSSDQILQILVDAAKSPEVIRAIRNLVVLAKIAGSLETGLLEEVEESLQTNLSKSTAPEPLSLWQLFKKLRSKDSRRALTSLTAVLESMGKSLDPNKGH
jgi:uncharacterized protein YjgD (DUF1641 family)